MNPSTWPTRRVRRLLGLAVTTAALASCTHLAVEDCGGEVLGENEARIRSSHFRMLLADLPSAADRFVPHAAMSALAYAEDRDCGSGEPRLNTAERARLESELTARGWQEVTDVPWTPPCEDDTGLFLRVWQHQGNPRQVVVAFRGTGGLKDWLYGNLHWLTRFLPMDDQYSRARAAMQRVWARFPADAATPTRFETTGHSLGGGLAQHALYSYPRQVAQSVAFDPSAVTGFADQTPDHQVAGCDCSDPALDGEARIYRVYDAYEILSGLRVFHKTFLPPERHMQEVRFANAASHSMKGLAFYLIDQARGRTHTGTPWFAGKGQYSPQETCTQAFTRGQNASCAIPVTPDQWLRCPS
jgi:hypothetical protein